MSPDHQSPKKVVVFGSSSCDLSYMVPKQMLEDSRVQFLKETAYKFEKNTALLKEQVGSELYTAFTQAHEKSVRETVNTKLLLDDIKRTASEHEAMPGGGGYNVAKNLQIIAAQMGLDAEITLVTKLGPERVRDDKLGKETLNMGAQKVRSALEDQNGYLNLIDIAENDHSYRTPVNAVLLTPDGRSIMKAPETGVLTSEFADHAPSYADRVYSDITHAIAGADLVVIQASKFPFIIAHAARVASQHGVPILVDYDISSLTHAAQASEVLEHAKYVVAPHDAVAPPRWDGDDDALYTRLVESNHRYHSHLTAVSDGIKPIRVNTDFSDFTIDVPLKELDVVDKNGSGDLRDAAFAYAILAGYQPVNALRFASALSSFGTHYPGREWANDIGEFFKLYQSYKTKAGLNGQSHSSPTPHSPAASV